MKLRNPVTRWLTNANPFLFTCYAALTAFCLYTCVYAFRKTFSVATFDDIAFWGISYKVLLVMCQVIGYACSKLAGIKIISELRSSSRVAGILLMTGIAALSWLLFALVPKPFNLIFLFTNGFPLGLVWGMIFGYLEGRRFTEALGAGLSISFIFSAGFAKSVGAFIIRDWGTSETWMPFVTSCVFLLPLLAFVWLLDQIPPPSAEDEKLRTKRQPMNASERSRFLKTFFPGIILFTLCYMLLTTFREFRDNFSAEVWTALGYGNRPEIFTTTEIPISIGILAVMGSLMWIRSNILALLVNHVIILCGMILIGISTFLFQEQVIDAPLWMMLIGMGLYLGYVPFNSIFFDRLLASFKYAGTVGFIMYLADSFGYLSSIPVLMVKELANIQVAWVEFFLLSGYIISVAGAILITGSMLYFFIKHARWKAKNDSTVAAPPESDHSDKLQLSGTLHRL